MNQHFRIGEAHGISVMKFTLTYEGELRPNDDYKRKWSIRRHLAPQLEELWRISPVLQNVLRNRHIPAGGYMNIDVHHTLQDIPPALPPKIPNPAIDLCADVSVGSRPFFPLVRDSFALRCGLKIIFLRKEDPGKIYQGGDLDNRLKTLFDALSVPDGQQIDKTDMDMSRIYCLMENDRLISSLSVDTHRLLAVRNVSQHYVNLIIEVDVKVVQSRMYNHAFLGD